MKVKAKPADVLIFSGTGALIAIPRRRSKGTGDVVMDPEHHQGLLGADLALFHFERLAELGLSPFTVERHPLSLNEEVAHGGSRTPASPGPGEGGRQPGGAPQ